MIGVVNDYTKHEKKNRWMSQGAWTFRRYERTITKSLAEEPMDAGTSFAVDAVQNHRSTKL